MPSPIETVLVCAAHPDDEVLGCGGAIARHAAAGDAVYILILGQGVFSREGTTEGDGLTALREAGRRSCALLGARDIAFADFPDNRMDEVARLDIVKVIEEAVARHSPGIVYTHHFTDLNVDHGRVHECVSVACRPQPGQPVRDLRFFETPSSTEWRAVPAGGGFTPTLYIDVEAFLGQKLQALREYDAEMRPWPHARSYEAIEHLARWRGASVGLGAAEAFVIGRQIVRKDID